MAAKSKVAEDKRRENLLLTVSLAILDLVFAGLLFKNGFQGLDYGLMTGLIAYPLVEVLIAGMALFATYIRLCMSVKDRKSAKSGFGAGMAFLGMIPLFFLFALALIFGLAGGILTIFVLVSRFVRVDSILAGKGGFFGDDNRAVLHKLLDVFGPSVPFAVLLFILVIGTHGETTSKEAMIAPAAAFVALSGLIAAAEVRRYGAHHLIPFIAAFGTTVLLFLPPAQAYPNQYAMYMIVGSWYVSSSLSSLAAIFAERDSGGED